jgi:(1->4)-alpha-D-glucan 1-alpha-D-glucosylmutase
VRARLDVLSELPTLWTGLVTRWQRLNKDFKALVGNVRAPDAAAEILCYQTIVGIWPIPDASAPTTLADEVSLKQLCERVEAYMLKAAREAKAYTSWTNIDTEYENALIDFVRGILAPRNNGNAGSANAFLADIQRLVARIARPGFWNSLSRTLIQFTSPGTPDLYQGDELWNFALVDPDNRRPVDYASRQALLQSVVSGVEAEATARAEFVREMVASPEDGRVKLHLIRSALVARRELPEVFAQGTYEPLEVTGARRDQVFAFARHAPQSANAEGREATALIVVPRYTAALSADSAAAPVGDVWGDTAIVLPEALRNRPWRSMLIGEKLSASDIDSLIVADVLGVFPAAILISR